LSSLVSAVSLSSESLNSIYTMTLWKAENLIRVSLAASATPCARDEAPVAPSAEAIASPALFSARDDLSIADCALIPAVFALSPREPITFPDSSLVRTRQTSDAANAATSRIVERLWMCFLRSSVSQLASKSATSSPAQAMITSASEMYSPNSQWDRDLDNDSTSKAVKIILAHAGNGHLYSMHTSVRARLNRCTRILDRNPPRLNC